LAAFTLTAHAAFFIERAPAPHITNLAQPGPQLAISGGLLAGVVAWAVLATCFDQRRERCLLRWMSELVSGALVPITEFVPPIARIALGASLAWCAALGSVSTPNLHVEDAAGMAMRMLAVSLGAMLVLGIRVRAAAVASIALFAAGALVAGHPVVVLERLDIIGLAVFVSLVGGERLDPRIDELRLRAIGAASMWLRVLVAGGLVVVAITEKLANVPMTARILREHPHVDLGLLLGTTPTTTVLLLGAAEIAFATLVLLLPLPELVALAIGAPFVLSVGEFGLLEVPGHLPVWGSVAVLALLGAHPQTADLLGIRPPWLRTRARTPEAARARVIGDRVPWSELPAVVPGVARATTIAPAAIEEPRHIFVGGGPTVPTASEPLGASIPAAPPLAPQVAAWLAAPASAQVEEQVASPVDAMRFQWAAHAGAGVPA
jgi:hypothetical protein